MKDTIFIPNHELEKLFIDDKLNYFKELKNKAQEYKDTEHTIGTKIINTAYPYLRNFDYEFEGVENIPTDGNVIFACNHSNSHDILITVEVFNKLCIDVSPLVANDDLTFLTNSLFYLSDAIMFDRKDKVQAKEVILKMSKKLLQGKSCLIFSEATWNIHPKKAMHDIKIGAVLTSAITDKPIVPVIFEYVEVPHMCNKETELYTKCIIKFGKPIKVNPQISLVLQTNELQSRLEGMRLELWDKLWIDKSSYDLDKIITYLNHTYLKKFKGFGFRYNALEESKYLFSKKGLPVENEYRLFNGIFIPGVTSEQEGKKYLIKR